MKIFIKKVLLLPILILLIIGCKDKDTFYPGEGKEFVFVIKTHPQDNGMVTNYAYLDSGKPLNVILIGDITQKSKIISKQFILFDEFDFNVALVSSDWFLTSSSSSIPIDISNNSSSSSSS